MVGVSLHYRWWPQDRPGCSDSARRSWSPRGGLEQYVGGGSSGDLASGPPILGGPALAVRVPGADAFDTESTVAPGGGVGAADLDERHGPVADGLVELGDDLGRDRTELGRPRGGVGTDHDDPRVVRLRRRVRGHRFAHDIGPAPEFCTR